jgi:hypothetical protein
LGDELGDLLVILHEQENQIPHISLLTQLTYFEHVLKDERAFNRTLVHPWNLNLKILFVVIASPTFSETALVRSD